jgi:hypothetical protein
VTGNQWIAQRWQFAINNMEIGPANSARAHFKKNLTRPRRRPRHFLNPQRLPRRSENCRSRFPTPDP